MREASLKDVPMIARVHVDTWRTTYHGIMPEEYLAQLSKEEVLNSMKLPTDGRTQKFKIIDELTQN